jgi:tetratricopeptide (TPR) repeat protein
MRHGYALLRQGAYASAIDKFTEETIRRPSSSVAYRARAHANLCLGEYERAVEDYSEFVRHDTRRFGGFWVGFFRATPLWITGRHQEAAEDHREVHRLVGRVSYADARLYLVLRDEADVLEQQGRLADACEANDEASEVLRTARLGATSGSWLSKILECLAGNLTPEQLVAAADPANKEEVCESYYYAGEAALLMRQAAEARAWFSKCVDTGVVFDTDAWPPVPMNEYHLARWRMSMLSPSALTTTQAERG